MSDLPQPVQLQAFLAVVEFGSYTRAAEHLGYSEPAVHQQVRGLEKTLGLPLVSRQGKRVAPTLIGRKLLPFVSDAANGLQSLDHAARQLRQPGLIRVGAGRRAAVVAVMPLVSKYLELNPGDDVELSIPGIDEMFQGVVAGSFDFCISGLLNMRLSKQELMRHRLRLVPWKRFDDWVIVGAPDKARAEPGVKVFIPSYYGVRGANHVALLSSLPEDPRLIELDSDHSVRQACVNGLGLGLVPIGTVRGDLALGALNLFAAQPGATQTCFLLHKRPSLLSPSSVRFLRFLLQHRRDEIVGEVMPSQVPAGPT